jgi:hypothetical protein
VQVASADAQVERELQRSLEVERRLFREEVERKRAAQVREWLHE